MNWLLPEYIADALPAEAARVEGLRRKALDLFTGRGYELVMPPLLEYLDSLLTGTGRDLKHQTFEVVDQLSGRTLGVRADITPQVARIDAHLLNRRGVTRLCYCGSVLHSLPRTIASSRQPLQIGAELYGYAGIAADLEVIRLLAQTLEICGAQAARIDLGHVGIFRALAESAQLDAATEEQLLTLLRAKDVPGLAQLCESLPNGIGEALLRLPHLFGGVEVLARARAELPPLQAIGAALDNLAELLAAAPELPFSIDLSDLRGYHYHNGVVFAAYRPDYPAAIAQGGRYDGVGEAFGRARPATGFSFDLREVARLAPVGPSRSAIVCQAAGADVALRQKIEALRAAGETVVELLPGEAIDERPEGDRRLRPAGCQWIIDTLNPN